MNYKTNVFGRWLNGMSQFAHACIALSNTDISMSAKTGWKSMNGSKWFKIMEKLVDFTFYPLDGPDHCKNAYLSDRDEDYTVADHWWSWIVISIIEVLGCIVLMLPIRIIFFLRNIYMKTTYTIH